MTNKTKPKKPPAHEVILDRLHNEDEVMQRFTQKQLRAYRRSRPSDSGYIATISRLVATCSALLQVLWMMQIPKHARPKVVAELRKLHALRRFYAMARLDDGPLSGLIEELGGRSSSS